MADTFYGYVCMDHKGDDAMADILDVLAKLMAHEESARKIGSAAEAEAFAGKIQELLLKHNLTMGEVEATNEERAKVKKAVHVEEAEVTAEDIRGVGNTRGRYPHLVQLALVVADGHFCRLLLRSSRKALVFIGEDTNRQVAMAMYQWLARQMILGAKEAHKMHRAEGGGDDPWAWAVSYYQGFYVRIRLRYGEMTRPKADHSECQALMVVERNKEATDTWTKQRYPRLGENRSRAGRVSSPAGMAAGDRAGQSVALHGRHLTE